jgi:general secretion pathway protein K
VSVRAAVRGFALVTVMWLLAALSLLALSLAVASRAEVRGAQGDREFIEAALLGDAAIELAVRELRFASEIPAQGAEFSYEIAGRTIRVRAVSAAGYIDLNTASQELLHALFRFGAGLDQEQAETLAQRVIDWRDPDDAALPLGAENENYEAAGSAYRTRGGEFQVKEDLLQVLGLDFDVYDTILGFITTFSGAGGVQAEAAPAGVLRILAEGDETPVDTFLAARAADPTTLDMTAFRTEFLGGAASGRYRVAAVYPREQGPGLVRVRWVDFHRDGTVGRPWYSLATETVRAVDEGADGG